MLHPIPTKLKEIKCAERRLIYEYTGRWNCSIFETYDLFVTTNCFDFLLCISCSD